MLSINQKQESIKITNFVKSTLKKQGFEKVIIPVSGGIDSSICLILLLKAISPKNIIALKLPYGKQNMELADLAIKQAGIPTENIININIKPVVKRISSDLKLSKITRSCVKRQPPVVIRLGNIMARTRMIMAYDLAKKYKALVCGTENKTEYVLGYYTRFGDEACDFSPIKYFYKTQVYQLAEYLRLPKEIINQSPSAGLWKGQTDEKEFGFTYKEADQILYLYFEKKMPLNEIKKKGLKNAEKVISRMKNNKFKQKTPYHF